MFNSLRTSLRGYQLNESDDEVSSSSSDNEEISQEELRHPPISSVCGYTWHIDQIQQTLSDSLFASLPTEILIQIFQLLSIHDLMHVSLVCRYFKFLVDQDDIWRSKCNPSNQIQSKSYKQIYMDWTYGKYLRHRDLKKIIEKYKKETSRISCCLSTRHSSKREETKTIEHPDTSAEVTMQLSSDIERTIIALIALVEKTSEFMFACCQPTAIAQMIKRYYRFMQLKVAHPQEYLVPTLDIEIVWQTHLIRPEMYRGDCLRLFHCIIDHSLLLDKSQEKEDVKTQAFIKTCQLYEERFGEQYCPLITNNGEDEEDAGWSIYHHSLLNYIKCPIPSYSYWDKTHFQFAYQLVDNYQNPFSFVEEDIILDRYWFRLYSKDMYEVGMRIIEYNPVAQPNALHLAIKRLIKSYERFLYITAKYSSMNEYQSIHPTCAIDIAWHSHMQEPLKYADDCNRLVGFIMNHTPWSSTRTANDIAQSRREISEIWNIEFERSMERDHLK
ncbi:unnamed protein product [Adineta ricciae]|nr:unnamed protein product [Adineta ricciae]